MGKPTSFEKLVRQAREAQEAEREAKIRHSGDYDERFERERREYEVRAERADLTSAMLWEDVDRVVNSLTIAKVVPNASVFNPNNLPATNPYTVKEVHSGDSRSARKRDEATRLAQNADREARIAELNALPKIPAWNTHQRLVLGLEVGRCGVGHETERTLYIGSDSNLYFEYSMIGQLCLRDDSTFLPMMARYGQSLPARDSDIPSGLTDRLTANGLRTALAGFVAYTDLQLYDVVPAQAAV